jgi:hypothetical protein
MLNPVGISPAQVKERSTEMRRHRRPSLGTISDTWNYSLSSAGENLEYTHRFTDTVNEAMMEEDRLEEEKHIVHPETPANEPTTETPTGPNPMPSERQ